MNIFISIFYMNILLPISIGKKVWKNFKLTWKYRSYYNNII